MPPPTAPTIGNFDGVHRGHVALVRAARDAIGEGGRVVVATFDPHPASVLRPAAAPERLSRLDQRRRWLLEAGADEILHLEPTPQLLGRTPEQFMSDLLEQHPCRLVVEGPDFRFGRDCAGSTETLERLGRDLGFSVRIIEPVDGVLSDQHVVRVSSSMIRWLLRHGRVRDAMTLLGRPYTLRGEVVSGARQGRHLSMPTANIDHGDCLLPADGVYAAHATGPDGRCYPAAVSVGTKPTFGREPRVCETHLIGFDGGVDEYGWTIDVQLTDWVREQLPYRDIDALVGQMRRDVARVLRLVRGDEPAGELLGVGTAERLQ